MLEFIVSAIISSGTLSAPDANEYNFYENYINYQLQLNRTNPLSSVKFKCDIPAYLHEKMIKAAEKSGWYVTVEPIQGFYVWQKSYVLTFMPK